jgi:hypothetical protein
MGVEVAFRPFLSYPQIFWAGKDGDSPISLIDQVLCGLKPTHYIIYANNGRFQFR